MMIEFNNVISLEFGTLMSSVGENVSQGPQGNPFLLDLDWGFVQYNLTLLRSRDQDNLYILFSSNPLKHLLMIKL